MTNSSTFNPIPSVKKKKLNVLPQNPEEKDSQKAVSLGRFPSWLHRKLPKGGNLGLTGDVINSKRLHTVCEEAKCPNLLECWSKKTATFLVLGKECTRSCGFCDIDFSKSPQMPQEDEPERVAESVLALGLKHVVITHVARDDLPDGGAKHVAKIIEEIRKTSENTTIEVLTSDFSGNQQSLDIIIDAAPEIFNHNIETTRALTPRVRHKATYDRTLNVLSYMNKNKKNKEMIIKSGLMVGLGESKQEAKETIQDLYDAGCHVITIGQYLQASRIKLLVKEFVTPETFKEYEEFGKSIGVKYMFCGPFVRSSYNAGVVFDKVKITST